MEQEEQLCLRKSGKISAPLWFLPAQGEREPKSLSFSPERQPRGKKRLILGVKAWQCRVGSAG